MLNPARANNWTVASCSEPFGMPSFRRGAAMPLRQRPEEARALARVTYVAVAEPCHLHQERVVVAIDQQLRHLQPVARGLPLGPQRVASAAEEGDVAGLPRPVERLLV